MKTKSTKKSKIDSFRDTLSTAKSERPLPTGAGIAARLAIHEVRIEKHLTSIDTSFFEIGKELAEIRDENDYGESTFEAYIKNRWNRNRDWGYKMIQGYQVKAGLPENVLPVIQNQKQALALGKAPEKERAAILKEVANDGEVTPKKIAEKIKEKSEPKEAEFRVVVKDANGDEVPEAIEKEFQRAESGSKEQISNAQQIKNFLEHDDTITIEARALRETAKDLLAGLKTHLTKHVLCPKCGGKKCGVCSKRGFVSNHFATKGIGKK